MAEETRPRGLGRGLSALIGDEAANVRGEALPKTVRTLPVEYLTPNRFQPRKRFDEADLQSLVESVREKGILQPILVRPLKGDPKAYEIVAGERRWRAAQAASLHDVPVVVREMSDAESLELAIVENVQRADLNAIEEAAAYHELMDRFGYTQERIAQEVGKSRSHVANTLRLLKLPETIKTMVREGKLSAGHARTLVGLPDAHAIELARLAILTMATVRQAEQRSGSQKKTIHRAIPKDVNIEALETSLSNHLGLKAQIMHKADDSGELRIAYKNIDQLDDLIRRLKTCE